MNNTEILEQDADYEQFKRHAIETEQSLTQSQKESINDWLEKWIEYQQQISAFKKNLCLAVIKCILQHFPVLLQKRRQCTYKDDYGKSIIDGWEKEQDYFIENVVIPYVKEKNLFYTPMDLNARIHKDISNLAIELRLFAIEQMGFLGGLYDYHWENSVQIDKLNDIVRSYLTACGSQVQQDAQYIKKFDELDAAAADKGLVLDDDIEKCADVSEMFMCVLNAQYEILDNMKGVKIRINDDPTTSLILFRRQYNLREYLEEQFESGKESRDRNSVYLGLLKKWLHVNISLYLDNVFSDRKVKTTKSGKMLSITDAFLKISKAFLAQKSNNSAECTESHESPLDYEKRIADLLQEIGFNARTTKASGDQGVDVLADKNGVSFAIQCKLYTKPVGNKAVQEVSAGQKHYNTDYGVVVSNADFTKSARQLANTNNIILLHDTQMEKLLEYI
ncbi:restriction endonuclease [bacterium]|nr:restriction endonuclease [bacterium]